MDRSLVLAAIVFGASAVGAATDEPVPWPTGQAPDAFELDEQVRVATDLDALERGEEFLEALEKGEDSEHIMVFQEDVDRGRWTKEDLFAFGDAVFGHEFRKEDGFGAAPAVLPLSRVHAGSRGGLDTFSCAGCHSVGGPDGAGSLTQNALLDGDGDHASTAIVRNAPAALGLGFVQVLGSEMSAELAHARTTAITRATESRAPVDVELIAKGVRFGTLRALPDGSVDTSRVEGIAPDLVVRPFGWKGTTSSLRRFVEDAARGHFGIQSHVLAVNHERAPDPRLGSGPKWFDPDGDGKQRELEEGALTATVAYLAMVESPIILPPHDARLRERWAAGSVLFDRVGCSACHVRELAVDNAVLHEAPDTTGGPPLEIDLLADGDKPKAGTRVRLFSDLKRHDMGVELADARDTEGLPRTVFLTRPLWGLAETAPYMHDGSATTIPEAILAHGGEAKDARDRFAALGADDAASLHVFLLSLTRTPKPRVIR